MVFTSFWSKSESNIKKQSVVTQAADQVADAIKGNDIAFGFSTTSVTTDPTPKDPEFKSFKEVLESYKSICNSVEELRRYKNDEEEELSPKSTRDLLIQCYELNPNNTIKCAKEAKAFMRSLCYATDN